MKNKIIYLLIFLVLSILTYIFTSYIKNIHINQHLELKSTEIEKNYDALYHNYQMLSEVIYKTNINTKEVLNIFKDANGASLEKKREIRDKLYAHLKSTYSLLKENNLKQLHFHLKNNKSFLRFHRPQKYGDDLTTVRETVKYVNDTKKPIDGFEEGRIYNGYRFVFPLFAEKEHLGSVEISFSTISMSLEFFTHYKEKTNFLILKENIDRKVFKEEKNNYMNSPFKDFYLEKKTVQRLKEIYKLHQTKLTKKTIDILEKRWREKATCSLYDTNIEKIITFIKVKHPVTGDVVGILAVTSDDSYINKEHEVYIGSLVFTNIFIALLLFLIYKEMKYRKEISLNNKKLTSILDGANSGIGLMSLDGDFLEVNRAYSDLLGYTQEELLHLNCVDLTKSDTKDIVSAPLEEALIKGNVSKIRKICISKSDKEVHLEFSLSLLPSKEAFIVVVNSLNDKLLLEKLNENLERRVKEEIKKNRDKEKIFQEQSRLAQMGEMISMIAHQWRQPLGAISSSIISIQMKQIGGKLNLDNKEDRETFLDFSDKTYNKIHTYIEHLTTTIDDFRNFFQPDKEKELVSLNVPISKALQMMESSLISKKIDVNYLCDCTDKIYMYKNELIQVILNIIKNSEDNFIDKKIDQPTLFLKTLEDENSYIIAFSDNGGGIDENILSNIFDPYFSTKNKKNGTGLGLYMSKTIIEEHHQGILDVENTKDGVMFKIHLPKAKND